MVRYAGMVAGILLGTILFMVVPESFMAPDGAQIQLGVAGRMVAALSGVMATWWMTEAIPVYATALLPIAILPITGAMSLEQTTRPYANDLIFLFLGGFVLALAMQRSGLHRRIALMTISAFGSRPRNLIAGFMVVAAILSMWVSNTATTMMMLPIAISLLELLEPDDSSGSGRRAEDSALSRCLLLSIAYAASIGGLGTLIGSPPNGLVASFTEQQLGRPIGFGQWMIIGIPLVIVLLPIVWWLMVRCLIPVGSEEISGGDAFLTAELRKLGSASQAEWSVFVVFCLTATGWILRPWLASLEWRGIQPAAGLSDAGLAITAALVLFALPAGRSWDGPRVMDWESMKALPWGLLILFGGGLSLAQAIEQTGLSAYLGTWVGLLDGSPEWLVMLAVIALIVLLTEITSNTATVAAMLPILAVVATGMGMAPLSLLVPAALAGSCAFMLPVATPPNAIVYGTGRISIRQMASAGMVLNLVCLVVLLGAAQALAFFGNFN